MSVFRVSCDPDEGKVSLVSQQHLKCKIHSTEKVLFGNTRNQGCVLMKRWCFSSVSKRKATRWLLKQHSTPRSTPEVPSTPSLRELKPENCVHKWCVHT